MSDPLVVMLAVGGAVAALAMVLLPVVAVLAVVLPPRLEPPPERPYAPMARPWLPGRTIRRDGPARAHRAREGQR